MDCSEIRLEIEKIEDLRHPGHELPPEVTAHLESCKACAAYHEASCKLENHLFSEIKNVNPPESGIKTILQEPHHSRFRRVRFLIPAAAAVLILISVLALMVPSTTDISKQLVSGFIEKAFSVNPVHAEEADTVLAEFRKKTGINAELPPEITSDIKVRGELIKVDGKYSCLFKAEKGNETFTFFVFSSEQAEWTCCCKEKCLCLSNDTVKALRWKSDQTGYLIIDKMDGKANCNECHDREDNI